MKPFMDEDFLLQSPTAKDLYHGVAEKLPIIDYHCHLNPREIAEDRRFQNLTEAWLQGDHYKWRAMRLAGVEERLVTGPADDRERFMAWAAVVPQTVGNPLFHWTHLELRRYLGIADVLTPATAQDIWERANAAFAGPDMGARGLIRRSNVRIVCTTDDPADDLRWHAQLAREPGLPFRVVPAWRPDKALNVDKPGFAEYVAALGRAAGSDIRDWDGLLQALDARLEYFRAAGCRVCDHAFERLPYSPCSGDEAAGIFARGLAGAPVSAEDADRYRTALMLWLGRRYAALDWAMQMHVGATRNNNTRMFRRLGPDTGFDAVADHGLANALSGLLDALEQQGALPKTVVYSLNPNDNYAIASLMGCFPGSVPAKVQLGSAWWFVDHLDGMERQLRDFGNTGLLSRFVGMLTDSRSFLSYTRHEYFRRLLCNMLGRWVEEGECPNDPGILEPIVRGVCCDNAARYFGFPL